MEKMKNKSKILIVDDTDTNIDILLELLGERYDVLVALDGKTAINIANKEEIDLILLDIMMPEMDGYEVCQSLKHSLKTMDIPILFITAKSDEDSIEKAYDVGGSDYITKPFKPRELLARIKTQLQLRELIKHLDFIATYDEMTGIYNRRQFFKYAIERFEESKKNLCAVMVDIDNFKNINDKYGHATGDKVIIKVAKTIADNVLKGTVFGRIGGEEFALICNASSKKVILENIELIRSKIEESEVLSSDGAVIKYTISEGVSQVKAKTKNLDELLNEADKALYEAKGSGRNRVIFR
ncbi:MAG: diguanylate cyclase [Campylobacterota bacterium]|nr:diguanylate cyclase [Campylobacterota bacterium]